MLNLYTDRFRQLIVNIVTAILDRYRTAAFPMCDYCDRFTAVAAQREKEGIQFFIIGFDFLDNVFFSFNGILQIHIVTALMV